MNELLLVKDAAAELGLDGSYLTRRIKQGALKADKFGGRDWRIKRSDLMKFDAARRRTPGPRVEDRPGETDEQRRLREYNRIKKQKSRAAEAAEKDKSDPPAKKKWTILLPDHTTECGTSFSSEEKSDGFQKPAAAPQLPRRRRRRRPSTKKASAKRTGAKK